MKEREEQLKLEGERKEIERKQKEETDAVRNEVNEYRKSIAQIQKAILDSRENLRNWFKLFDENNDNFMEFEEFKKLLQQVKVVVKDKDLKNLFELMDISQTGRISYNDFCDVIEKNQLLPIDKIVRKRREERGEKFIDEFSKGEKDFEFEGSQPFKSAFGELGGSQRKDLGTVDGMSDIMRRSDADFYNKLRPACALSFNSASQELATRRMMYDTTKIHRTKYKSSAKDKRRASKRARVGMGLMTPRDIGEEQPLFFQPQRTKIYMKIMQDIRNNHRISRKPMPDQVRQEFVEKSKDYHAYKLAELRLQEDEYNKNNIQTIEALDSIVFLPDQLFEECLAESGESRSMENFEYTSGNLYLEQILRIFPREYTVRLKFAPAFEETLMKYEETRGGGKSAGAAAGASMSPPQ